MPKSGKGKKASQEKRQAGDIGREDFESLLSFLREVHGALTKLLDHVDRKASKKVPTGKARVYTLAELSQQTGISLPTLQRYKQQHQERIPSVGTGRQQRYPESALPVFQAIKSEGISRRGRSAKNAPPKKAPTKAIAAAANRPAKPLGRPPRKRPSTPYSQLPVNLPTTPPAKRPQGRGARTAARRSRG